MTPFLHSLKLVPRPVWPNNEKMSTQAIGLALSMVLFCQFASAQWVHTSLGLPDSSRVSCFAVSGTNLFAGTDSGVYRSTDNGTSWTSASIGLTNPHVSSLVVGGTNTFAGTSGDGVVFHSTNNGASWTADTAGMGYNYRIRALAVNGTNIFAGTYSRGVFRSTDNAASWTIDTAGLNWGGMNVYDFALSGLNLYAGTGEGVILSTNNGMSWAHTALHSPADIVVALAVSGTNLFAASFPRGGYGSPYIFLSTDGGASWTVVNSDIGCSCLVASGTNLFAGTGPVNKLYNGGYWGNGVFLSTNNGTGWTRVNTGLLDTAVTALAISHTNLFAGTAGSGVWRRPLSEVLSVDRSLEERPISYTLEQNYPNPFNPTTKIQFTIVNRQSTIVKVFDLLGREVTTLVNEVKSPGTYTVEFNGSNLASGTYFYRLQAGDYVATKKLLIVK